MKIGEDIDFHGNHIIVTESYKIVGGHGISSNHLKGTSIIAMMINGVVNDGSGDRNELWIAFPTDSIPDVMSEMYIAYLAMINNEKDKNDESA